jgi:hypothetical protein
LFISLIFIFFIGLGEDFIPLEIKDECRDNSRKRSFPTFLQGDSGSPQSQHRQSSLHSHSKIRIKSPNHSPEFSKRYNSNFNEKTHSGSRSPYKSRSSSIRYCQSLSESDNSSLQNNGRLSVFDRLKDRSPRSSESRTVMHSFPRNAEENRFSSYRYEKGQKERINITVRNTVFDDNSSAQPNLRKKMSSVEIMNTVNTLEQRQKDALNRCNQFQREILKLESLIISLGQDIKTLKAHMNFF